jgi:hypothetical protein
MGLDRFAPAGGLGSAGGVSCHRPMDNLAR